MVGCWELQINMWFWEGSGRLDELKVKGLWMVIDHQDLAPSRLSLSLLPRLWSSTNVFPRKVGRLPPFFWRQSPEHVAPVHWRPSVIAHWHLGTWKCFSWVWVTPHTQEGPPVSLPPSLFFLWTRPWHVVCGPVLGGKTLIRLANVTTLWKQHRTFYTRRRTWRLGAETEHLLLGITRCLVKWNMRETLHYSPVTMSI